MKKLITLLLCAALVVMPSLAFADDFDFLTDSAKNSTYTTELTITLDKPLEILSLLSENNMLGDMENYIDIRKFCEGLFGTELSCSAKINMSDDFKKIKLSIFSVILDVLFIKVHIIYYFICILIKFFCNRR